MVGFLHRIFIFRVVFLLVGLHFLDQGFGFEVCVVGFEVWHSHFHSCLVAYIFDLRVRSQGSHFHGWSLVWGKTCIVFDVAFLVLVFAFLVLGFRFGVCLFSLVFFIVGFRAWSWDCMFSFQPRLFNDFSFSSFQLLLFLGALCAYMFIDCIASR